MCVVYKVVYIGTVNNSNKHGMACVCSVVYWVVYIGIVSNSNKTWHGMCV